MSAFPHVAEISSEDPLTLERAAAVVREALVDRRYGETPLGEHVVAYLDALEYADAATNTLTAYEYVLGLFAVEHADLSLQDLEPPQGGGVVRAFLDRHWRSASIATRKHRLAIVRSFLSWLVGEGLLSANPAQNIRAPKSKRAVRNAFSREDIDGLIAAQPSLRDQAALMLLAYLGLRKDELRRVCLEDIDLEARTITVHGKGGHVDTLPIGFEHVYNALALYLRDRLQGYGRHRHRSAAPTPCRRQNDAWIPPSRPGSPRSGHETGRDRSRAFKRCPLAVQFTITGVMSSWGLNPAPHAKANRTIFRLPF